MRKKVVSPRSVQRVVVLSQGHGPLTVHKAKKKKKKSAQTLKDVVSAARTVRAAVVTARVIGGIGRVANAVSRRRPLRRRIAALGR